MRAGPLGDDRGSALFFQLTCKLAASLNAEHEGARVVRVWINASEWDNDRPPGCSCEGEAGDHTITEYMIHSV